MNAKPKPAEETKKVVTPAKRPYTKPVVAEYGTIRDVTLGSVGLNTDSPTGTQP